MWGRNLWYTLLLTSAWSHNHPNSEVIQKEQKGSGNSSKSPKHRLGTVLYKQIPIDYNTSDWLNIEVFPWKRIKIMKYISNYWEHRNMVESVTSLGSTHRTQKKKICKFQHKRLVIVAKTVTNGRKIQTVESKSTNSYKNHDQKVGSVQEI